ncbi:MAG: efflux RND transporter periplasmic adaptor subunit [Verrucomicrobiota bacterium]
MNQNTTNRNCRRPRSAESQSAVSQSGNLRDAGIAGRFLELITPRRLQIGDTAGCKPALRLSALALVFLTFVTGCKRANFDPAANTKPPPVVHVQIIRPHRGEITRAITLPTFRLLAYQQATLYAKVAGYLKTITVDKGDAVTNGQLLAEIEVPELLADRTKYEAEVEAAETDYRRVMEARRKAPDLVMPLTVDNAKARFDVAKANRERLETLLGFAKITAPFTGVVTMRWVDPGAFIPAATSSSAARDAAVLTEMDFTRVRVQVAVPQTEVAFIKNGRPAQVTVGALPSRVFNGSVTRYSHALDEATKTMLTEIEISNPDGELLPGMFASVKLVVERKPDALLVPAEALVIEKSNQSVFTVVDHKAKKVPVKMGFNDGISVEIAEGLRPDEPVVLVGKQMLTDGQPVNAVEAK